MTHAKPAEASFRLSLQDMVVVKCLSDCLKEMKDKAKVKKNADFLLSLLFCFHTWLCMLGVSATLQS